MALKGRKDTTMADVIEPVNAEELGFTKDDLDGIVGAEEQGAPSELQEEEPNGVNPQD